LLTALAKHLPDLAALRRLSDSPVHAPAAGRENTMLQRLHHVAYRSLDSLEVADAAALHDGKRRLTERGIEVVGPTDHGFCKSIYFFDPSGHRMEMTARTERAADRDRFAQAAPAILADWEARRRAGALTYQSVTADAR
jgi:Glyoxalase/Bleomycin resistance protein/Dioxygenase superfamily